MRSAAVFGCLLLWFHHVIPFLIYVLFVHERNQWSRYFLQMSETVLRTERSRMIMPRAACTRNDELFQQMRHPCRIRYTVTQPADNRCSFMIPLLDSSSSGAYMNARHFLQMSETANSIAQPTPPKTTCEHAPRARTSSLLFALKPHTAGSEYNESTYTNTPGYRRPTARRGSWRLGEEPSPGMKVKWIQPLEEQCAYL